MAVRPVMGSRIATCGHSPFALSAHWVPCSPLEPLAPRPRLDLVEASCAVSGTRSICMASNMKVMHEGNEKQDALAKGFAQHVWFLISTSLPHVNGWTFTHRPMRNPSCCRRLRRANAARWQAHSAAGDTVTRITSGARCCVHPEVLRLSGEGSNESRGNRWLHARVVTERERSIRATAAQSPRLGR